MFHINGYKYVLFILFLFLIYLIFVIGSSFITDLLGFEKVILISVIFLAYYKYAINILSLIIYIELSLRLIRFSKNIKYELFSLVCFLVGLVYNIIFITLSYLYIENVNEILIKYSQETSILIFIAQILGLIVLSTQINKIKKYNLNKPLNFLKLIIDSVILFLYIPLGFLFIHNKLRNIFFEKIESDVN